MADVIDLQNQLTAAQDDAARLTGELETAQNDLAAANELLETAQGEAANAAELQARLDTITAQRETAQRETATANETVTSLTAQRDQALEQVADIPNQVQRQLIEAAATAGVDLDLETKDGETGEDGSATGNSNLRGRDRFIANLKFRN
jgi:chromosome segregation ATPase